MVKLLIWMCSQKFKSWTDPNYHTLTIINFSLHAWINVLTSRPKLFYLYYKDQKNGHEYKLLITYSLFLLVFHLTNSKIPPELGRTCKDKYPNISGQILVRDVNFKKVVNQQQIDCITIQYFWRLKLTHIRNFKLP